MNVTFKKIKGDKIIRWGLSLTIFLLIIEAGYILLFYLSLPPVIPLFNQMPWGESRLGTKFAIFLPVLITISFLFLNFFLLTRLYEKIPLVSRIISIATLLVALLSLIFIIRTMHLIL